MDGTRKSSGQRLSNREEGMPDHLTTEKGIIAALADTSTSHPRRKARYLDGVDGPNRWKSPCKESTSLKSCPFPLLRLP